MSILDIFRNKGGNDEVIISELQDKVVALEAAISKSALSDSLGYVSGSNYYTYNLENTDKAYKNNYTVYRGINLLADMVAQLPMRLYRGQQELPIDHVFPNGFSMANPNPTMSLNELLYKSCIFLFFHGEFINHIVDDGIFRLEMINPKNIQRNPDGSWRLNSNSNLVNIQKEELIYSPLFDPTITNHTPYMDRGLSPIDVIRTEVAADSSAGKYITKFFKNYGQVGGTLIDKTGEVSKEEMLRTVGEFNNIHQSDENAYKTIGLAGGVEYKELSQTMREMQFLDSRKDIRDKILAVLGIHKALFGVTEGVNRSVMEEATRQIWVQTLKPKAIRLQEKYNQQLFRVYFPGYYVRFDFSEISELQDSMESILKQCIEFKKLGYTTNEINSHFGLKMPPIAESIGDTRFVPIYLKTLEQTIAQAASAPKEAPQKKVIDKVVELLLEIEKETLKPDTKEFKSQLKTFLFKQRKKSLAIINNSNNIIEDIQVLFNKEDLRMEESTLLNKLCELNKIIYNQIKLHVLQNLKDNGKIEDLSKEVKNIYNFMEKKIKVIAENNKE